MILKIRTPASLEELAMLVQLPIRTFADVASIGYGARIYCPICHRQSDVEPTSPDLRERLFFATRFRCTSRQVGW
jgi:hypothetical protein